MHRAHVLARTVRRTADLPDPTRVAKPTIDPRSRSVLVRVVAAGVNFADTLMARGLYQERPKVPFTLGTEYAGVVDAIGDAAASETGLRAGDRVYGLNPGLGAYADYMVVDPADADPGGVDPRSRFRSFGAALREIPRPLSFEDAASVPVAFATAHAGIVSRAAVRKGETVLVHAAAGATGSAAVQVARAKGARVIATCGGAQKADVVRRVLGADEVIDYVENDGEGGRPHWSDRVRDLGGADVVFDPVGGDVLSAKSLRCLKFNGRYAVVGFASGKIPSFEANRLLLKSISVLGVYWGGMCAATPAAIDPTLSEVESWLESGKVKPLRNETTFAFDQLREACAAVESRGSVGKVILFNADNARAAGTARL